MHDVTGLEAIEENRRLSVWGEILGRRPDQIGRIHDADAELVPVDGDPDVLLAINVDAVVEEIARGLYDPFTAGWVAVAGALSDLAAVGATPAGVVLAVTLPRADTAAVQREVALGARAACAASGTFVLGGDTSDGAALALSCTAVGFVPRARALTRIGARPGDRIVLTGPVGAGACFAATRLLGLGLGEASFRPRPRLAEGRALGGVATACMDTSDGLLATLDQLARLNRVRLRMTTPLEELLLPAAGASGLPPIAFVASPHGEYELVATVSGEGLAALRLAGLPLLEIGRVKEGAGVHDGDRALPTARLRNLWEDARGDVGAWLAGL